MVDESWLADRRGDIRYPAHDVMPAEKRDQPILAVDPVQERNDRGVRAEEGLAESAGVPVWSLRNWEHDRRRPRADATLRLALALGVTVESLLQVPSSRPSRADVRELPGVRALKRAWDRASAEERRQFLAFVEAARAESQGGGTEAGTLPGRQAGKPGPGQEGQQATGARPRRSRRPSNWPAVRNTSSTLSSAILPTR